MSAPAQIDWNKYQAVPSTPAIDFSKYEAGKTSTNQEQPVGAGQRFIESLGAGLPGYNKDDAFAAVKDASSGVIHMFSHPLDSASLAYHGVVDQMELTNKDAIERMKKAGVMNKINGAIEYAESGVPFLGPQLAKAGQQFESSDVAGGLGTTAGVAVPFAAPGAIKGVSAAGNKLWSKVSPAATVEEALGRKLATSEADTPRAGGQIQPALNNTPREVLTHASEEGIKLTPGQATEDAMAQNLQKAGTTAAVGGKELSSALAEQKVKFGQAVNGFMDDVDPKRAGLSAESAGEQIKQTQQVAKSVSHDNASQGYAKIDYLMDKTIDGSPISFAWSKVKGNLPMGAEEAILAQTPRSMRAVVSDLLSAKPEGFQPTVAQTIQLRKFFREMGETEGLPNQTQGIFRAMSQAADSAAEAGTAKYGGAEDWRAANAGWKDYATKYGDPQSMLYKIGRTQDPQRVTTMLTNASAADINVLKAEKMDAALEPLKRQVVQDIAQSRFRVGHDGIGGYSDSYLKALFSPEEVKELYLKGDLANRLQFDPNPSGTGSNISSLSQLGLWNQTKMSAAAKLLMPRDPLSFLPGKQVAPAVRTAPFMLQAPAAQAPKTVPLFKVAGEKEESDIERMRR